MNTIKDKGQNFYKLLSVDRAEFIKVQSEMYNHEDNLDVILHRMVKQLLKTHAPEKYSWLRDNQALTTYIARGINYTNVVGLYVGFVPNDPIETLFIMRWS